MERLRTIRTKLGLTQKGVANKLGIHQSTYTKYETGDSDPSSDMLLRLAEIYDVSTDYLLGRDETDEKKPAPNDGDGLSKEQAEVVRLYDLAPPALQAAALAVLKAAEAGQSAPDGGEEE